MLHVAVGRPSAPYGEDFGDVTNYAIAATQHVRELAHQLAAGYVELWGTAATRDATVRAILDARDALRSDAPRQFVLSFTGHGGKIKDQDGDETIDDEDEAWLLDDAPLIDDEIMVLLREFPANINIAVLSNCCFADGFDIVATRGPLEARLAQRRRAWYDAVAQLGKHRLYAPLTTDGAPRARGEALAASRKWVLAAVCEADRALLATATSVFSSTILDTVFPSSEGARRRAPDATYHVLGEALAQSRELPLFAKPTVSGTDAVLRGLAFVAI